MIFGDEFLLGGFSETLVSVLPIVSISIRHFLGPRESFFSSPDSEFVLRVIIKPHKVEASEYLWSLDSLPLHCFEE